MRWPLGLLIALAAACVVVPMLAPTDPLAIGDVLSTRLLPPLSRDAAGHFHLLGTDRFGRDLFVRDDGKRSLAFARDADRRVIAVSAGSWRVADRIP